MIREAALRIFSIDGFANNYSIPDTELGSDPDLAKRVATELVGEIGLRAYEELQ